MKFRKPIREIETKKIKKKKKKQMGIPELKTTSEINIYQM